MRAPQRRSIAHPAKPTRDAEAPAHPPREGRDREVALAALDRVDQRREARGRVAEVGVAQQHHLIVGGPLAEHRLGGRGDVPALAVRPARG